VRTRACVLLGVVALASGCGGGGSNAKDALSKTAANLGKIRSGTLHVQLLVTPTGKSLGGATGFLIDGPFELSSGKRYPEAAISYTQLAAGKRATVRVISTGTGGVVIAGGKAHPLAPAQLEELRAAAAPGGGVGRVVLDRWLRNPNLSDGGEVGGASTDRVRADLDVVQAANGLLALAPGTHARRLEGANANRLAKAVRSARFELYTGKKDRLLRRATIDVDFALDVPPALRKALGSLVGARIHFVLAVDRPNEVHRIPVKTALK